MRELINFDDLREMFLKMKKSEYISRELLDTIDDALYGYLMNSPESMIKAARCGIHAEVVGPEGSFFICPDDYICLCQPFYNERYSELLIKPQESFEKNYVKIR